VDSRHVLEEIRKQEQGSWFRGDQKKSQSLKDRLEELFRDWNKDCDRSVNVNRLGLTLFGAVRLGGDQAIICTRDDHIIVSFKGTSNARNLLTDVNFFRESVDAKESKDYSKEPKSLTEWLSRACGLGGPRLHRGFLQAYQNIKEDVFELLHLAVERLPNAHIYFTGHSLGAAFAHLAAFDFSLKYERQATCYTFGTPRFGNSVFKSYYNKVSCFTPAS